MSRRTRLSLLELLVVVSVMATVAGGVFVSMSGVEAKAATDLTARELHELKRAVLQFKADTGFLPKQGPFALAADGGAVPLPAQGRAWFESPANLSQLYENPLAGTGHALEDWDPDRRRGWRGPYLPRAGEGLVVVGDGLALDGSSGSPSAGALLAPVPGLADPFLTTSLGNGACAWTTWGGDPLDRQGRPYLLLSLDDPVRARAVALGPDGRFEPTGSGLTAAGSDDVGVYLQR
jgi:type II secretory pathway pseudopilin PulG